ncbi:ABC transporter permease [Arsenicicoccus bolidensis]|uniref:Transport permease protein n=1 Tax=Arsenicicoccus bolidensis TaxID=229480 RepID=A0ABS9Q2E4_9MICO|nr:ABC transporter permease [Arsenicicoccus bolidensis]MCG7322053.1 ABC transporter permease [Arsenicicoccus bolidensis]
MSLGLVDVTRHRYLLRLIVRKELRARYQGSLLGMVWSYVKPAVQFIVFYFAVGVFLRMNDSLPNYAVYLFAGIVSVNYFSEILGNATRSIVGNAALVKKIYLPRELFPVSSVFVAGAHLVPQLVVLLAGALIAHWRPGLTHLLAIGLAMFICTVFALGLGLAFGAVNVIFRDAENLVDLLLMIATWASPVLYVWTHVRDAVGSGWGWTLYQLNPLTTVVELMHWGVWHPTTDGTPPLPPHLLWTSAQALIVSLLVLAIGQTIFRRLDGRFAQEL